MKKKCRKDIYSRDFSYYKKNKYLEALFWEIYDPRGSDGAKKNVIYLSSSSGTAPMYFYRSKSRWLLGDIDGSDLISIPKLYE